MFYLPSFYRLAELVSAFPLIARDPDPETSSERQ